MRPDLSLVAITVDEGTGLSRDLSRIKRFAEEMGIEWAGTSYAEEFGGAPDVGSGHIPVSCRDILRDYALTSLAGRMGATKLALGTSLDKEARSVLLSVLRGEPERFPGGPRPDEGGIPRIRPFLRIPEQEVALYGQLNLPGNEMAPCVGARDPPEGEVQRILDAYTNRHPAAPFSLVNLGEALLERRVPEPGGPRSCNGCRERFATTCPARGILDRVMGHG